MFSITSFFPLQCKLRAWMLFPGELLMQRGLDPMFPASQSSQLSLRSQWNGLWGQISALGWGRFTKWPRGALVESRSLPYLSTGVSRRFQGRSDLLRVLNDSLKGRMGRDTNYWMWAMHQTVSQVFSLCHLTQPQQNLVNKGIEILILPSEAAEMGRCLCQSYAMFDSRALDSDPRLAFCQRCIAYFLCDHITL